ncbi:MAG: hypothetical protein Q9160_005045 [Pyrenula sp. 1 TL-2023]
MSWMTHEHAAMSSLAQYLDLKKEDYKTLYYFAAQYFQIFEGIVFPSAEILRNVKNQDWIYYNMFDSRSILSQAEPHLRFKRRVLKRLIDEIESAVRALPDGEAVCLEISDHLTEHLVYLQTLPDTPNINFERMRRKSIVTYRIPFYRPRNKQKEPFIYIQERPNLISCKGTTGVKTWSAALHLGTYLSREGRHLVTMKRVLELGSGTGLLSILCSLYDAKFVLATDSTQEHVNDMYIDNILPNVQHLTALSKEDRAKNVDYGISIALSDDPKLPRPPLALQTAVIDWSNHATLIRALHHNGLRSPEWDVPDRRVDGLYFFHPDEWSGASSLLPSTYPIDIILGADLIFEPTSIGHLVTTLADLIAPANVPKRPSVSSLQAIIAATVRNVASITMFEELCAQHGMKVSEIEFRCPKVEDEEQVGLFHGCQSGKEEQVRLLSVERA